MSAINYLGFDFQKLFVILCWKKKKSKLLEEVLCHVFSLWRQSVRLWSVETGKCQKVIWVSPSTSIMALSYSQGYFACSYGNTICLYRGTKLVKTFNEHYKRSVSHALAWREGEKGIIFFSMFRFSISLSFYLSFTHYFSLQLLAIF